MEQKSLVRLNMHDVFTGAKHSVCKLLSDDQIRVAESLMVNGQVKRHFNKKDQITYDWVIDEVDVLV